METVCPHCGETYDDAGAGACPRCGAEAGAADGPVTDLPSPDSVAESVDELTSPDAPPAAFGTTPRVGPPAVPATSPTTPSRPEDKTFSRYRIMGELGRGGMGIVYKTYDPKLKRVVALKVLLAGDAASGEEVERFFREAESAASLHHPNIVPIHELDVHEGKHFFTMDFIEGKPLLKAIRETQSGMEPRRAVEIIREVGRAVHHAHEIGVVHRDLKPANILLTLDGRPMVTDFGLAKQVRGDSDLTRSGDIMGTPAYMAPEQARGRIREIDARTDVYALGAVLYEMITGLPPFVAATPFEIMEKVAYDDPIPPRVYSRACPQDVETICLKCLEKESARRYASAAALADDCERFLAGEPITARPASVIYRVRKRLARHRAVSIVSALALAAVVGLTAWYLGSLRRSLRETERERDRAVEAEKIAGEAKEKEAGQRRVAEAARSAEVRQRELAEAASERADKELYASRIMLAHRYYAEADMAQMRRLLGMCAPHYRDWEWGRLRRLAHLSTSTFGEGHGCEVSLAYAADGRRLTSLGRDGTLSVWDSLSGRPERQLREDGGPPQVVALSPGGETAALAIGNGNVVLVDTSDGTRSDAFPEWPAPITALALSRGAKHLAIGDETGVVTLIEVVSGRVLGKLKEHTDGVSAIALDAQGARAATGDGGMTLRIWDVQSATCISETRQKRWTRALSFSVDGTRLAGNSGSSVTIRDASSGDLMGTLEGHSEFVGGLAFSQDGSLLATGSDDRTVRVWDTTTFDEVNVFRGHVDWVRSVAFSPDGRGLASAGADGVIHCWAVDVPRDVRWLGGARPVVDVDRLRTRGVNSRRRASRGTIRHGSMVESLSLDKRGMLVAVGTRSHGDGVWEVGTGRRVLGIESPYPRSLVLSPDGVLCVAQDTDNVISVWNVPNGKRIHTVRHGDRRPAGIGFAADGKRFASASNDSVKIWDAATGLEVAEVGCKTSPFHGFAFSGDLGFHASSAHDSCVRVTDLATGETRRLPGVAHRVTCLAFSADDTQLAAGGMGKEATIWDVTTGNITARFGGFAEAVTALSFSRSGRRLFIGDDGGNVRVFDCDAGMQLLMVLRTPGEAITALATGTDGVLAVGHKYRGVSLCEADPWWEPGNEPKRPEPVPVEIKPVPEARPEGAGDADEQF